MTRRKRRLVDWIPGGRRKQAPPSSAASRSGSSPFQWGYELICDEQGQWRGNVRVRGPNGLVVICTYCPVREELVGGEAQYVPELERARIEQRLSEYVLVDGPEVHG